MRALSEAALELDVQPLTPRPTKSVPLESSHLALQYWPRLRRALACAAGNQCIDYERSEIAKGRERGFRRTGAIFDTLGIAHLASHLRHPAPSRSYGSNSGAIVDEVG